MELRDRAAGADNMINKKGQEEIMGFMLVVVMVMVIGLGLLFFFSPRTAEKSDLDMQNLLYAWSSSAVDGSKDVKAVIGECIGECNISKSFEILDSAISKSGLINQLNGYSLNITGIAQIYYEKGIVRGNDTRTAIVEIDNENTAKLKFFYP